MKLLFCRECQDVFKLDYEERICACGKVGGRYVDELNAVYWGDRAVPMGFSNPSLASALRNLPEEGFGPEFTAFLITKDSKTYKRVRK